jgi:outer membrane protein assembly factor BamB
MMARTVRHRLPMATLLVLALALGGCGIFKGGNKKPKTLGERVSVLDFEKQVQAEAELQDVQIVLPPQAVNAEWSQPGGSPSGAMGHLALSAQPTRVWQISIGQGSDATRKLNATPVVSENRLFAMDTEGRISAFDATSGRPLWQAAIALEGEGTTAAFGGGVSVGGGRVYASTGFGVVAAFDAATGAQIWRVELRTPLRAAPSVEAERIFVTSQDSQLTALNAATGAQLWQANATVEPASILGPGSPAVALDTVVAGFPSGELFALRVENGRTVWQDQLARTGRTTALGALSGIAASPVIDRGRVFAIGHGGRMAALELSTGQRVWERDFAGVSTPWPVGDWVYAVTVDAQLVALTRVDGKIRWVKQLKRWKNEKKKTGGIEWFGPVLAGDRLFVVSSEKDFVSVSPTSGEELSRSELSAPAYLPPIVANGMLYILTDNGQIAAYR